MLLTLSLLGAAHAADVFDVHPQPIVPGEAGMLYAGWLAAPAPDSDGDGFPELVVAGAVSGSTSSGLFLIDGASGGIDPTPTTVIAAGGTEGCCLGLTAGDLDGDGVAELIVGTQTRNSRGITSSAVWILGVNGAGYDATPHVTMADPFSSADQSTWGQLVAVSPDMDGDGENDLLVAVTRYDDRDPGQLQVFRGGPAATFTTPDTTIEADDHHGDFGVSMASAGDVNGDGLGDAVVGHSRRTDAAAQGHAWIVLGSPNGPVRDQRLSGKVSSEEFGEAVAGPGDLDGDGYDDVLVSDPRECSREDAYARVHVYLGSVTGMTEYADQVLACPDTDCSYWADDLAGAGDIDGDGRADVVIGSPEYAAPHAWLYAGTVGGLDDVNLTRLDPDFRSWSYGTRVAPAGDLDGDGHADLVVTDPYYTGGAGQGGAQVWMGGDRVEGDSGDSGGDSGDSGADSGDSGGDSGDSGGGDSGDSGGGDSGAPDTDSGADSGADDADSAAGDPDEDDKLDAPGCGCAASPGPSAPLGLLLAGLALGVARRRPRS